MIKLEGTLNEKQRAALIVVSDITGVDGGYGELDELMCHWAATNTGYESYNQVKAQGLEIEFSGYDFAIFDSEDEVPGQYDVEEMKTCLKRNIGKQIDFYLTSDATSFRLIDRECGWIAEHKVDGSDPIDIMTWFVNAHRIEVSGQPEIFEVSYM